MDYTDIYDGKFDDGTTIEVEAVIKNLDNAVHDIELSEAVLNVVEEKFEDLIRG